MKIRTNGFYKYLLELSGRFEDYCFHRRRYNKMVRSIQSRVNDALKERVNSSLITVEYDDKDILLEVLNKNHFAIVSEERIADRDFPELDGFARYRCTFTWEEK